MRVLFDQGTPAPLRHLLLGHAVSTAFESGWSTFKNGELLAVAEAQGFQVLVTTDKNLWYQQNLASRSIAIVVLNTTSWPRIRAAANAIVAVIEDAAPGTYREVVIP